MFLGYENIFLFSSSKKSSLLLSWKRWTKDLNRKYRSKDSKLCMYLLITLWLRVLFSSIIFLRDQEKIYVTYVHIPWNHFTYTDTMTGVNFDLEKKDGLRKYKMFLELYFRIAVLEVGVCFLPMALIFFCCVILQWNHLSDASLLCQKFSITSGSQHSVGQGEIKCMQRKCAFAQEKKTNGDLTRMRRWNSRIFSTGCRYWLKPTRWAMGHNAWQLSWWLLGAGTVLICTANLVCAGKLVNCRFT